MTSLRSLIVLTCAAAGAIGLPATGARAARGYQDYGGGICQPRNATNSVQYTQFGFVNNGTTAAITAECPFSGTDRCLYILAAQVTTYDRNATSDVV